MKWPQLFGAKWQVGIDIGGEELRIVCLKKQGNKYLLMAFGCFEHADIEGIENFLSAKQVQAGEIRCNLPDTSVFTKIIKIPKVPKKEIEPMLREQLEGELGDGLETTILQFQEVPGDVDSSQSFLSFAATADSVSERRQQLEKLGIAQIDILEPNILAVAHCLSEQIGEAEKCLVLLEVGMNHTSIAMVCSEGLKYARAISSTSEDKLCNQIKNNLAVSDEEAKRLKNAYYPEQEVGDGILVDTIQQFIFEIISEVQSTIEGFEHEFPERKLTQMVITGGGTIIKGLSKKLSEELNLEIKLLDAFVNIDTEGFSSEALKKVSCQFSAAVGLAL